MQSPSDVELLADYAAHRSEAAFAQLVERYVALVHSSARRQVGDPHLAEEITQAVFILLARKAGSLGRQTVLAGWLCRTAHFAARDALKAECRRQHREQLAAHMDTSPDPAWQQLAPLLDEAVAQLRETDRNAVVLRYYEQRPLNEIGAALGIGADAAQKRVARALEKLRAIFTKRGVTLTGAAIASAISVNSVQAAPPGLVVAIAAAKGTAATASALAIAKGALKLMTWANMKSAVLLAVAILLSGGATTIPFLPSNRSDNTYNAPAVEAFRKHLSSDAPIRLLRFSEIDGGTDVQKFFLAVVDGDDFFLREYKSNEDPGALISTNNAILQGQYRGLYYGRLRDQCWAINGPELTKSSVTDPVVNVCQLQMKTARETIDSVLNLGVSAWTVKRGSFIWNNTNSTRFTVGLASSVTVTRSDGLVLTNIGGYIVAKAGLVTKLETLGGSVVYQYATNSSVPLGIPTKITAGKRWFGYRKVFLIEELAYGHTDDPQIVFDPESKYVSPDLPTVSWITNGQRVLSRRGYQAALRPPRN